MKKITQRGGEKMNTLKNKNFWLWTIAGFVIGIVLWMLLGRPAGASQIDPWKVTICHNNGQSGNYTSNQVDDNAINGLGNVYPTLANREPAPAIGTTMLSFFFINLKLHICHQELMEL